MHETRSRRFIILMIAFMSFVLTGMALASAGPKEDITEIICPAQIKPVGLAIDHRSTVYMACGQTGQIFCLPPNGVPVEFVRLEEKPTALAMGHEKILFVGTEIGRVFAITPDGSVKEAYRASSRVAGLSVDRDNGLIIALEDGTVVKIKRQEYE